MSNVFCSSSKWFKITPNIRKLTCTLSKRTWWKRYERLKDQSRYTRWTLHRLIRKWFASIKLRTGLTKFEGDSIQQSIFENRKHVASAASKRYIKTIGRPIQWYYYPENLRLDWSIRSWQTNPILKIRFGLVCQLLLHWVDWCSSFFTDQSRALHTPLACSFSESTGFAVCKTGSSF